MCLPYFYMIILQSTLKMSLSNYIDADLVFDGIDVFALKFFQN